MKLIDQYRAGKLPAKYRRLIDHPVFPRVLKAARAYCGYSNQYVARIAGVSPDAVTRAEKGRARTETALRIFDLYRDSGMELAETTNDLFALVCPEWKYP
jgi:DNA-binding XRE family transcriptional regulator